MWLFIPGHSLFMLRYTDFALDCCCCFVDFGWAPPVCSFCCTEKAQGMIPVWFIAVLFFLVKNNVILFSISMMAHGGGNVFDLVSGNDVGLQCAECNRKVFNPAGEHKVGLLSAEQKRRDNDLLLLGIAKSDDHPF